MTPLSQLSEMEQDEAFEAIKHKLRNSSALDLACLVYLLDDGVNCIWTRHYLGVSSEEIHGMIKRCKKAGLLIGLIGDRYKLTAMKKVNRFERNKENTPKPKLNKTIEKVFR